MGDYIRDNDSRFVDGLLIGWEIKCYQQVWYLYYLHHTPPTHCLHKYFIFYFVVKLPSIIFLIDRDVSTTNVALPMLLEVLLDSCLVKLPTFKHICMPYEVVSDMSSALSFKLSCSLCKIGSSNYFIWFSIYHRCDQIFSWSYNYVGANLHWLVQFVRFMNNYVVVMWP